MDKEFIEYVAKHFDTNGNKVGLMPYLGRAKWGKFTFIVAPDDEASAETLNTLRSLDINTIFKIDCIHTGFSINNIPKKKPYELYSGFRLYARWLDIFGDGEVTPLASALTKVPWYEESYYYTEVAKLI